MIKSLVITLVIALSCLFASNYELYKLIDKYNILKKDYMTLQEKQVCPITISKVKIKLNKNDKDI